MERMRVKESKTNKRRNNPFIAQLSKMSYSELHNLWRRMRIKGYYPDIKGFSSTKILRDEIGWTLLKEDLSVKDFQII